jgi:hypothetical protein
MAQQKSRNLPRHSDHQQLSGKRFGLAFPISDENGGKIMVGKIIKTPHDFAPNDFAKSCILTLSMSPQAHRQ